MRYQDWDVLLFPSAVISTSPTAHAGNSVSSSNGVAVDTHIPVKEFRTTCHTELSPTSPHSIPLVTCFIPSLPKGAPFQISVHSWVKTGPRLGFASAAGNPQKVEEVWQAKVVVDGMSIAVECWGIEHGWPRVISMMSSPLTESQGNQLRFPPFHREIIMQSGWCAADRVGRIRVELASGYVHAETGHFVKVSDTVTFAFQHAPLETLEHCGVAWPNNHMFANPIMEGNHLGGQAVNANSKPAAKRKKAASTSNIGATLPSHYPTQAMAPCPVRNDLVTPSSNYDLNSSRSTSAYSTVPDLAAPLIAKGMHHTNPGCSDAYVGATQQVVSHKQPQISFRLPSDQLSKIIDALGKRPQVVSEDKPSSVLPTTNPSEMMPPPPVPQRVSAGGDGINQNATTTAAQGHPQSNTVVVPVANRRDESRFSDVSMHNNCTSFPTCTTEDANGTIVHAPADCPSPVVKGKKEGSSAAPKRKLSISAETNDQAERKRTRRSSRLLQHDSGYAGGPSDDNDGNGDT